MKIMITLTRRRRGGSRPTGVELLSRSGAKAKNDIFNPSVVAHGATETWRNMRMVAKGEADDSLRT